jgi:hypothetical protein
MKMYRVWSAEHPEKVLHALTLSQVALFLGMGYYVEEVRE